MVISSRFFFPLLWVPKRFLANFKARFMVAAEPILSNSTSRGQGQTHPKVKLVREVVREVAGFAPYERRIMELLRIGSAATMKRALKFAKKRLGTHKRGKKKREEMTMLLQAQRRKQAGH
jgi:large subunit ribosomal protein L36e